MLEISSYTLTKYTNLNVLGLSRVKAAKYAGLLEHGSLEQVSSVRVFIPDIVQQQIIGYKNIQIKLSIPGYYGQSGLQRKKTSQLP